MKINWDITDFAVLGALVISVSLLIVFAKRKIKKTNHRLVAIAAILFTFLLIWAELAVGIFGTPFAGS